MTPFDQIQATEPIRPMRPRRSWRAPLIATALAANTILAAAAGGFAAVQLTDADTAPAGALAPREVLQTATSGQTDAAAVYARANPSVVQLLVSGASPRARGTGSGFVVADGGLILTNQHVIAGTRSITVRFSDGQTRTATVVGTDRANDLALLRTELPSGVTALPLGSSSAVTVGEVAIAIGSPFGLDRTVTQGIISAVDRTYQPSGAPARRGLIQTDAPINPGNSGGPLLNARGEVIGINSLIESPVEGSVGIGFAVPIDIAKELLPELQSGAQIEAAYLGVSGVTLDAETARAEGAPVSSGVLLVDVVAGSPAAAAGLRPSDVVTAIDGRQVTSMDALAAQIRGYKPGDKVRLSVVRASGPTEIEATLAQWPANTN